MITGLHRFPTIARSSALSSVSQQISTVEMSEDESKEAFERFKGTFVKMNEKLKIQNKAISGIRSEGIHVGDYSQPTMPIESMKVDMLPWSNYSDLTYGLAGCGCVLLGQVTGANPWEINALMKVFVKEFAERPENKHLDEKALLSGTYIPAEFMSTFLNMHGIDMMPLSMRDLCPRKRLIENRITKKHVVLAALHVAKEEQTWCIIYQDKLWHNIDVQPLNSLEFLNNPIAEAYLLYTPNWKMPAKRLAALMDMGEAEVQTVQDSS
jgi:hypothetical protein